MSTALDRTRASPRRSPPLLKQFALPLPKNSAGLHLLFRCTERPVVEALEVVGPRISVYIPSDLLLDPPRRRGRRRHGVLVCFASSDPQLLADGAPEKSKTKHFQKMVGNVIQTSGFLSPFWFPFQAGRRHSEGGKGERRARSIRRRTELSGPNHPPAAGGTSTERAFLFPKSFREL